LTGTLFIIVPAYNEEKALTTLLPDLKRTLGEAGFAYHILAVNDGSSDQTSQLLKSLAAGIRVTELRHEVNQGYGASLKTGFLWVLAHARPGDVAVSLDGDTTHEPRYIPPMVARLDEGYDIVTASYDMTGGQATGVPFGRRIASRYVNLLFKLVSPWKGVSTYTNGFRAYRLEILQEVHHRYSDHLITDSGFPGGTELFLKACASGARCAEYPFHLHYENRCADSKIRIFDTITRYLRLLTQTAKWR